MDQARQILATGKSINFLRQVCRDDSGIRGIESLRAKFDAINGTPRRGWRIPRATLLRVECGVLTACMVSL